MMSDYIKHFSFFRVQAMQARKVEISAQKEIMMTKKRSLLEEKSELKKTLEQINLRIAQLQKR